MRTVVDIFATANKPWINSRELQKLLRHGLHKFNIQLVEELVADFGKNGFVNLEGFKKIWKVLIKFRSVFDRYAAGSLLSVIEFRRLLEDYFEAQLDDRFYSYLLHFYNNRISFDVVVHVIKHLLKLERQGLNLEEDINVEYWNSAFSSAATPSAPQYVSTNSLYEPPAYHAL